MIEQTKLTNISSYVSKLLKKFGKGPKSCHATISKRHLVIYISGFLSPMEEVLLETGQNKSVDRARAAIIDHLIDEIKGVIQVSFNMNMDIDEHFHDWNFPNNSGMMIFTFQQEMKEEDLQLSVNIEELESEVSRISQLVQKVPDEIRVFPISSTILLVERKGILIPIEQALISKGFKEELKFTKDQLEKEYFHRYGRFDAIFGKSLKDIFIDWDFKGDKSMMAFIFDR